MIKMHWLHHRLSRSPPLQSATGNGDRQLPKSSTTSISSGFIHALRFRRMKKILPLLFNTGAPDQRS